MRLPPFIENSSAPSLIKIRIYGLRLHSRRRRHHGGRRYNRMRTRSDHVHLLLMLSGILTVSLWIVAAGGVGSQQASAQQQYESAVPGNGVGDDGGTPTDGDGDTDAGDNQCSGDVASVDPVLDEWATTANAAFNAPEQMQLGETTAIELVLSPKTLLRQLAQQVTEPGEVVCVRIAVGDITQARLQGSNFKIEPLTPETQTISPKGTTKWKWVIEPTKGGEGQELHLTISAFVKTPNGTRPHAIETFDRTITVNVTWGQRLANFVNLGSTPLLSLLPLLTAAGALGTWLGARLQRWRANRRERSARATRN